MTALLGLTTRLRLAKLALVVPSEYPQPGALAEAGADLLVLSRGRDPIDEAAQRLMHTRQLLASRGTLVATDSLRVAGAGAADVVFRQRSWFALPAKASATRLLGRATNSSPAHWAETSFVFTGPAWQGGPTAKLAELCRTCPPLTISSPVWFAAGGIQPDNVKQVIGAGARRIAAGQSVFGAADPLAVTRHFAEALADAWHSDPAAPPYTAAAFGS